MVFKARFKEKVPVYLDKYGGLAQAVWRLVVKTAGCILVMDVPPGGSF